MVFILLATFAAGGCASGQFSSGPSKNSQKPVQDAPAFSLSAHSLGWGNVPVGSPTTQTILVFNFGSASLTIGHVGVFGSGFTLDGKVNSFTVQAGHTATVEVVFSPIVAGFETGAVLFATNDPSNPTATVSLSATGVVPSAPEVLVSPASLAFGNVAVGATGTHSISVENTGGSGLSINSLTTTGRGFTVIGPTTSKEISAGASASFEVIFAPVATGSASGDVVITTNASAPPIVIPLSGMGVVAAPLLSVSSTSVSFGNVVIGTVGTQNVVLTNSGSANLAISQIGVTSAGFGTTGLKAPATLSPGQSATLVVSFTPVLAVLTNGSLSISSNASGSGTTTISLSGAGVSIGSHSVELSWSASISSNIAGYNVYRSSVSEGQYTRIGGLVAGTSFSDTTVAAGQTYYYVLTSVDRSGIESGYSSQAVVTVPGS